jgi:hypothetical protein
LNELSKNADKLDLTQFKEETKEVNQILNKAIDLIVPEDNSTLTLITASWLLDAANAEYESGVRNGNIIQIVEYQDAIGFISRSESLLNDTLPMLNQSMNISADETKKLFAELNLKVQNKADIDDIRMSTNEIKQKISNITGF